MLTGPFNQARVARGHQAAVSRFHNQTKFKNSKTQDTRFLPFSDKSWQSLSQHYSQNCPWKWIQGILKVSLYCWPPVWLFWNQLYENWQLLFLFAKQTNPNQSNRRSTIQWHLPLKDSLIRLIRLPRQAKFIHNFCLQQLQQFLFEISFKKCWQNLCQNIRKINFLRLKTIADTARRRFYVLWCEQRKQPSM